MVWYAVDRKARKKKRRGEDTKKSGAICSVVAECEEQHCAGSPFLEDNLVSVGCVTDGTGVGKGVVENFEWQVQNC